MPNTKTYSKNRKKIRIFRFHEKYFCFPNFCRFFFKFHFIVFHWKNKSHCFWKIIFYWWWCEWNVRIFFSSCFEKLWNNFRPQFQSKKFMYVKRLLWTMLNHRNQNSHHWASVLLLFDCVKRNDVTAKAKKVQFHGDEHALVHFKPQNISNIQHIHT